MVVVVVIVVMVVGIVVVVGATVVIIGATVVVVGTAIVVVLNAGPSRNALLETLLVNVLTGAIARRSSSADAIVPVVSVRAHNHAWQAVRRRRRFGRRTANATLCVRRTCLLVSVEDDGIAQRLQRTCSAPRTCKISLLQSLRQPDLYTRARTLPE